jgi:tetratricopeptide (TPR) repeat protein
MRTVSLLLTALVATGCGELRGRSQVRDGNALYKEGRYADAVRAYTEAERRVPNLPALWLNKGIACRQLMIPGGKTPESEAAAICAIDAFAHFKELRPKDPRGDELYVQTLFDADRFPTLASMYHQRLAKASSDIEAVNGLIQVYSRSDQWKEALEWYRKKADILSEDAEAQYAVGVFLWQQLARRGGGQEKASFDPRPNADLQYHGSETGRELPIFAVDDLIGAERVTLADSGISYLEKAVRLRSNYREAMVYLNLLYRQKSFAYFSRPALWQACVDEALRWQQHAVEAENAAAVSPRP